MTTYTQDVLDVTQTVTRAFTTADAKDFDGHRACLADELTVDFGGVNDAGGDAPATAGRVTGDEMRASAERVVGPVALTQHMITNLIATVEGDDATVTFYEAALHVHPALGDDPAINSWTIYGRGEHRLHRTTHGWKIVHQALTPVHHTGNTSLLADVAALQQ